MARLDANWSALWPAAGAAACLAGLWMSAATLHGTPARIAQLHDKHSQLRELQELERRAGGQGAREVLDQLASPTLPPVADVAEALVPGAEISIREDPPVAAGGGWMLRSVQLAADDVPLAPAMDMAAALESERPPWRVRAARIVPNPQSPGTGRVELTLSGLHREDL